MTAVFMKSHLRVLETPETQRVLLEGMEYLVSIILSLRFWWN